jgi:Tfp pilus assembly major pilin PilA
MKISRAFTLIELCIVFAITSILSVLGVIAVRDYQTFQKTTYIVHSFKQTLNYARFQAVFHHEAVYIVPENERWQSGWTIGFEHQPLKAYPPMPLPITLNRKKLKIQVDGTAEGSNATIEINHSINYVINRGGRMELKK